MNTFNPKRSSFSFLFKIGTFDVFHSLRPNRLTVLNYHRIYDYSKPDFDNYLPNVSASPDQFALQLDYLKDRFNFISVEDLIDWINGETNLPRYPALITFDDGYRDNLSVAFPLLRERNIPAAIFITTDFMDSNIPFFWDLIAYSFHHTSKRTVSLPYLGTVTIADQHAAAEIAERLIVKLKSLPEKKKLDIVSSIPQILAVDIPENVFSNNHLSWDEIRYLSKNGVSIGSHTRSHPILTRISLDAASQELSQAKLKLETELGKEVTTFAYPNGSKDDFNNDIMEIVKHCGYEIAFSLITGSPNIYRLAPKRYQINRIYIGKNDTMPRFAAKVSGLIN